MLVKKKASTKKTLVLLVITIVIVFTAYLLLTNSVPTNVVLTETIDYSSLENLIKENSKPVQKVEDYEIENMIFEDPRFNELVDVQGINLIENETGNMNPFIL